MILSRLYAHVRKATLWTIAIGAKPNRRNIRALTMISGPKFGPRACQPADRLAGRVRRRERHHDSSFSASRPPADTANGAVDGDAKFGGGANLDVHSPLTFAVTVGRIQFCVLNF